MLLESLIRSLSIWPTEEIWSLRHPVYLHALRHSLLNAQPIYIDPFATFRFLPTYPKRLSLPFNGEEKDMKRRQQYDASGEWTWLKLREDHYECQTICQ